MQSRAASRLWPGARRPTLADAHQDYRERLSPMTKLIAALAILAAAAWAVTAAASWIARKKAPLAIGPGRASPHATAADEDKAMGTAQLRTIAAFAFAAIMFAALFRISIGLSGQAGLPVAFTAGLSASGGLLLFSALPAARLATASPAAEPRSRLLPKRAFILPAATLAAFAVFVIAAEVALVSPEVKNDGVPLLLTALALAGSALLALHRLATAAMLPDPRMAGLDRRWREISARTLLHFANGALLSVFGAAALLAAAASNAVPASAAAAPSPNWATACAAGGAALALAGVVLLVVAAKGALTLRTRARGAAPVPVPAA